MSWFTSVYIGNRLQRIGSGALDIFFSFLLTVHSTNANGMTTEISLAMVLGGEMLHCSGGMP